MFPITVLAAPAIMQLKLILAIAIALLAMVFALQNVGAVTVSFGLWSAQGSLALVLLLAFAAGAVVAGLLSSLTTLRSQLQIRRLKKQIAELERAQLAAVSSPPADTTPQWGQMATAPMPGRDGLQP